MTEIDLNQSGIYAITSPSGKRYIGSAVNIRGRWAAHRHMLSRGKHHCPGLQHAYTKYSGDFVWSVLVLCPKEELIREEQRQMDLAANGTLYNANPVAGSNLGTKQSQETIEKRAKKLRGRKRTEECKLRISIAKMGKKRTPEQCAKMSAAHKGKKLPPEVVKKIISRLVGRAVSEETRQKMRAAALARAPVPASDVAKKNMSLAQAGKKKRSNTSGFVGVYFNRQLNKWYAQRHILNKSVSLGLYPTAELANQTRQNFDRILRHYDDD